MPAASRAGGRGGRSGRAGVVPWRVGCGHDGRVVRGREARSSGPGHRSATPPPWRPAPGWCRRRRGELAPERLFVTVVRALVLLGPHAADRAGRQHRSQRRADRLRAHLSANSRNASKAPGARTVPGPSAVALRRAAPRACEAMHPSPCLVTAMASTMSSFVLTSREPSPTTAALRAP